MSEKQYLRPIDCLRKASFHFLFVILLLFGCLFLNLVFITNSYAEDSTDVTFNEDYFRQSSYEDNIHLANLSLRTVFSSNHFVNSAWSAEEMERYFDNDAMRKRFESMGFDNISVNKYYTSGRFENSAGVMISQMLIKRGGKNYTLLAVFPQYINYGEEWIGNVSVGAGNIHCGFKAARDETLRYLKHYIDENNITGNLKVWVVGFSRGGSIANMVGGYLLGGGTTYLGNKVSLLPENIYCYTFAAPSVIKNGVMKKDELSVEGRRAGKYFNYDTNVSTFKSNVSGKLDLSNRIYDCIHNYRMNEDFVPKMPLKSWDFTVYGNIESISEGATWDDWFNFYARLSPMFYYDFVNNKNFLNFKYHKFDLASMSMVVDETVKDNDMGVFLDGRIAALTKVASTNKEYVEGNYQSAVEGLTVISSILMAENKSRLFDESKVNMSEVVNAGILSYLAFAIDLNKSTATKSISDDEALSIWLEDFGEYLTGETAPKRPTVDFLVYSVAEFVAEHPNSKFVNEIVSRLIGNVNGDNLKLLRAFVPTARWKTISNEELVKEFIIACARGPVSNSPAHLLFKSGADVRKHLYGPLSSMLGQYPELQQAINGGRGSLVDVAIAIRSMLTKPYGGNMSIADAANISLRSALSPVLLDSVSRAREVYKYSDYYADDIAYYVNLFLDNIDSARKMISYGIFYVSDDTKIEDSLALVSTCLDATKYVDSVHACHSYVSWLGAREEKVAPMKLNKLTQEMRVLKIKKVNIVKYKMLKKKYKKLSVIKVKNYYGKLKFKKVSSNSKFKINTKTGKVTVKKGLKKGLYRLKIEVTVSGDDEYKPMTKRVTVNIRVK